MKIQKTLTIAYESAEAYLPVTNSLKMLGTEALYTLLPGLQHANITSKTHSFISIYDFDHSFYYRIDRMDGDESVANEIGLGTLTEHNGNIVLIREQPIYVQAINDEKRAAYGTRPLNLRHLKNNTLIVTSYIPTNIVEALPDPHMIIISLADHSPHPLKIEKQSVVGRLDDTIESIKISDLTSSVAPTYKNTNEAPKIKGLIIFSEEWDCLKYYNGTEWKSI
jgi:hypothetical protein